MDCVADYRNYPKEKGKSSEQILKAWQYLHCHSPSKLHLEMNFSSSFTHTSKQGNQTPGLA